MKEYEKICSLEEFFEDPYAPIIDPDVKYFLMDEEGNIFGFVFHVLKECRTGPRIYFIDDCGYPEVISKNDMKKFGNCFIVKESNESSEIRKVMNEFRDGFREFEMAKEIVKLRKQLNGNFSKPKENSNKQKTDYDKEENFLMKLLKDHKEKKFYR